MTHLRSLLLPNLKIAKAIMFFNKFAKVSLFLYKLRYNFTIYFFFELYFLILNFIQNWHIYI